VADLLNLLAMYSKGRPTPAPLLAAGQKLPRQLLQAARNLMPSQHQQRCAGRLLWAAWQVMSAQQQWGAVGAVPRLSEAVQAWVAAQGLHLGLEEPVCLLAALGLLLHLASTGAVSLTLDQVEAMGLHQVAAQLPYPGRDAHSSQTLARLHRQLLQVLIWALQGARSSAGLKEVSLSALRALQDGLRHQLQVGGSWWAEMCGRGGAGYLQHVTEPGCDKRAGCHVPGLRVMCCNCCCCWTWRG
jgi:hypothetical protein